MRFIQWGCFGLFLLPFLLFFLFLDGFVLSGLVRQLRSSFYSSVPGTITRSEVVLNESSNYRFEVRYTYEVDGQTYLGDSYRYSPWGSSEASSFDELASRFPQGASVRVFYRPGSPGDAVLLRGMQGVDVLVLLLHLGLIGGGVFLVTRYRKKAG